jgi:hypothetical protein
MASIRLELDFIEIERRKKRWNIYFILATDHPTDPSQIVLSVFPNSPFRLTPKDHNRIDFEPKGSGNVNGLFVLERKMPEDESIRARLWVVQSRDKARNVGDVMQQVSKSVGGSKVSESVLTALGAGAPWVAVGKSLLTMSGIIGKFLSKSKDSKKGFINMDESFTVDEINMGELDRSNRLIGFGDIGWTWAIDKDN